MRYFLTWNSHNNLTNCVSLQCSHQDTKPHKYFNDFFQILAEPYINLVLKPLKNLCYFYKIIQRVSVIQESPLKPPCPQPFPPLHLYTFPCVFISPFGFALYPCIMSSPFILPLSCPQRLLKQVYKHIYAFSCIFHISLFLSCPFCTS